MAARSGPVGIPRELADLPNVRELCHYVIEQVFDYRSRVSESAPVAAATASVHRASAGVTLHQVLCDQLTDAGFDSKHPLEVICSGLRELSARAAIKKELSTLCETWERYKRDLRSANVEHIIKYSSYLGPGYFDEKMAELTLDNCFTSYYWKCAGIQVDRANYPYLESAKSSPMHTHPVERERIENSRKRRISSEPIVEVKAARIASASAEQSRLAAQCRDSFINWHTANYNSAMRSLFSDYHKHVLLPALVPIVTEFKGHITGLRALFTDRSSWLAKACDPFITSIAYSSSHDTVYALFKEKAAGMKSSLASVVETGGSDAQRLQSMKELAKGTLDAVMERLEALEGKNSLARQLSAIESAFVSHLMTSCLRELLRAARAASAKLELVAAASPSTPGVCGREIAIPIISESVALCASASEKIQTALDAAQDSAHTGENKEEAAETEEKKEEEEPSPSALVTAAIDAAKEAWKTLARCDMYAELKRRYSTLVEYLNTDPRPSLITALRVVDPDVDTKGFRTLYVNNGREAIVSCLWETTTTRASPIASRVKGMGEVVTKALEMVEKQCIGELCRFKASADSLETLRIREIHKMVCADWVIPSVAYATIQPMFSRLVAASSACTTAGDESRAELEACRQAVAGWASSHKSSSGTSTERTEAFSRVFAAASKLAAFCESAAKAHAAKHK